MEGKTDNYPRKYWWGTGQGGMRDTVLPNN